MSNRDSAGTDLPVRHSRLAPLIHPLQAFLSAESAGGIILLACTILAMAWANSPWRDSYHSLWHTPVSIGAGSWMLKMPLEMWVNDGLMAVFFLLVGLEIKRELLVGELASIQRAALPVAAAAGGMIVPALIYSLLNPSGDASRGWGVPMATDIAFAVGILTLLGRGVPPSLKVFLLAIAIVDDLGAVLVIAVFYTSSVSFFWLAVAGVFLAALVTLNILHVLRPLPYMLLGIGLWVATFYSGVHATIAGVLLAFTIPAIRRVEEQPYIEYARNQLDKFASETKTDPNKLTPVQTHALVGLEAASQAVQTPLQRVEHGLLRVVSFGIIPIFALANAGIDLTGQTAEAWSNKITLGVFLGLFLGKPIGVMFFSWSAIRIGLARLPEGANWKQVLGIAILCGIGFTMSIFIGNLAFENHELYRIESKLGVLGGSLLSGVAGALLILFTNKRRLQMLVADPVQSAK